MNIVLLGLIYLKYSLLYHNHLDSSDGLRKDTADTSTGVSLLVSGDVNVTRLTPISTPRVLNDERVDTDSLLPSDSEDGMVKLGTAVSPDDTGVVELEGVLISFDEDRDGVVLDSSLEGKSAVGGNEGIVLVDNSSLALVELALTVLGSVRIRGFSFKTVLSGILDSEIRPATFTTLIGLLVTINDLLFGERDELLVLDEVPTFKETSGRESPA